MNNIRKNHVSPGIYHHETNKTTKHLKQNFTSSSISGGHSHIKPSSKPQGGGGGNVPPIPPMPQETRIVAKFYVEDTSSPTAISFNNGWYDGASNYSSIEIDDVVQSRVTTSYTFDSRGEHVVKYTLKNSSFIARAAFDGCVCLTSVYIPSSVESIEGSGFTNCYNLTSVTFGDNSKLNVIGLIAFGNCRNLAKIDIPESVTLIEKDAFYHCSGLTTCTIGSGVTSIGGYAFCSCKSMTSVTFSEGSQLTNIGMQVFAVCSSLKSIIIPRNVTSIGQVAFGGCNSLTNVTVNPLIPPTLGTSVFDDTSNCPIYVPNESVGVYKAANNWSNYANRIQPIQ